MPNYSPLAARLESKTVRIPESGCWVWTGTTTRGGYGMVRQERSRKTALAHRVSYELHKGPIPEGKHLDHVCRVRCCLNPEHLEPVTNAENARRGLTGKINHRNARKTACMHGHSFDGANLFVDSTGRRHCRQCMHASDRRRRARA